MPDQSLQFDLTDLYMAAPAFQRAGGEISDAVSKAQSTLMGMGTFWGSDAAGQAFGAKYQPNQEELLQMISIMAGSVAGISDALNTMAATYGVSEQTNVSKMHAIQQEMQ
jgi:hypothetical protein